MVKNSKVWKIYQMVGPIGTKFGTRLQIHMGMVIAGNKQSIETRGSFWGLGGQHVIRSLRNAMICREKKNYIKMKCTNRHNYAATIPGEAG